MNKLLSTCIAVLAFTNFASAKNFEGWYVGGTLGAYKTKNTLDATSISYSSSTNKTNFGLGGVVGWGYKFSNNLYLGAELGLSAVSDNKNSADGLTTGNSYSKISPNAHLVARLGYVIEDRFMPYIFGGGASARYDRYVEANSSNYEKKTGNVSGSIYGIGIDVALTDHVNFRTEYAQMNFQNLNSDRFTDVSTKYSTNALKIGIIYNFA